MAVGISLTWVALASAVLFNVLANVSFKFAVTSFAQPGAAQLSLKTALGSGWLWIGGISCVLLLGSYLYAMRGIGLGTTYAAVTSLALIFVSILSAVLFGETLTIGKLLGVAAIILGIVLIMQSEISQERQGTAGRAGIELPAD